MIGKVSGRDSCLSDMSLVFDNLWDFESQIIVFVSAFVVCRQRSACMVSAIIE